MLNFKKLVLPTMLAASILIPGAAFASPVQNTAKNVITNTASQKMEHKKLMVDLNTLENYVPGSKTQLQQVFVERRELMKQFRELYYGKLGVDTSFMNDFKKIVEDTHKKVESGNMTKEDAKKYIKEQKKEFNKEHADEIKKLKAAKKDYEEKHKDETIAIKQMKKQSVDITNALNDALKSGDAVKIKEAYNNYLSNMKASNEFLKNQINSLKSRK
ncbi:MAG: hypothetical protein F8N39_05055 [Clostridiaceae bacterium]|nr:hypothetical protein [Clostridiaceae bacterium]